MNALGYTKQYMLLTPYSERLSCGVLKVGQGFGSCHAEESFHTVGLAAMTFREGSPKALRTCRISQHTWGCRRQKRFEDLAEL
eukprot:206670-Amphidinium_carterae.1